MIFTIQQSDTHSQVKVTARTSRGPRWATFTYQDNTIPIFTLDLPDDINLDDVEVFVEYVSGDGQVDLQYGAKVLKTAKRDKLPPRGSHVGH